MCIHPIVAGYDPLPVKEALNIDVVDTKVMTIAQTMSPKQ